MTARVQEMTKSAPSEILIPQLAPTTDRLCEHCGSPLPPKSALGHKFCCKGCEFVFHTLKGLGLSSYYSMRSKDETPHPRQFSSQAKKYLFLDDKEAHDNFMEELENGLLRIRLYLSGIHCAACIWLLEKLPSILTGVKQARVQFASGEIEIDFDQKIVQASEIAYTLNSLGYPPVPVKNDSVRKEEKRKERQMMLRIGVAAVCASNTMMLSVSLFQGFFTGIEEPYASLFRWLSAAIALPAVVYSAIPFYRTAIAALITGALHIDLPIAAAIILTYISGVISTIQGQEYVYFDSVTALIFLLLVGRLLQGRAVSRARASALSAWDLLPSNVRIIESGIVTEKPVQELQTNDVVEVLPGERVPSDGIVISGHSTLDSSFLTGESLPQEIESGAEILGGCINIESRLLVKTTKVGSESRLGHILKDLEKSQSQRTPAEDRANKLSGHFVVGVFFLAIAAYLIWKFIDPTRAFDITVSILIVTCPCALGLAIPAAVTISLGRAKKRGIFIRHSDSFEALATSQHFYIDKTGTLTAGEIEVKEVLGANDYNFKLAQHLASFAPLHPVSKAIVNFLNDRPIQNIENIDISATKHLPGRGVESRLMNQQQIRLGSLRWLAQEGIELNLIQKQTVEAWSKSGFSISALSIDDTVQCLFALADSISANASELINYLKLNGKEIFILSGDSQGAVNATATTLGIKPENALGELFPEQKSAIIKADKNRNCMIGDGLNDAQAMKESNLSIGLRGGVEATIEVASIYISSGQLKDLLDLLKAAHKTSKVIRNNLCYAVTYNVIGGVLAVFGYVNPLVAAILMPLSSITIVSYSLLSKTFKN